MIFCALWILGKLNDTKQYKAILKGQYLIIIIIIVHL